jgi:hypothetical protein
MRPGVYISTVTVPAESYGLVDLASCKIRLGVTGTGDDAFLTLAIADASAAAIRYMNNPILAETLSDQIWPWRDAWLGALIDRGPALKLKRWPLISVTSVVETIAGVDTTLVEGTDFLADPVYGRLTRLDLYGRPRNWNADPVTVVYVAGYETSPSDLQETVCEMVKARYYARQRDPAIRAQNVEGVLQTQYWFGSGPGSDTDMPPPIQAKLDRYRVPVAM